MKFLDQAKIYLKSGDGGPGCISFHREKFIEHGGPDGGNGGKGGDIIFEVVDSLNTLIDFRYQQHFKAQNGMHGMGRLKSGKGGEDCIVRVPVGTVVIDEEKEEILADFTKVGQRVLFMRGGDGGFGNAHYKSATNQAPRKNTPGWPGQEMAIWLRLKLIADAGLVGLPNAGKSTFLAACSNARPKIADYPFTTLAPNLGMVKAGDTDFVLADIPGLIEGAHMGHGLGDRFLGHVERTSALLHLIDSTQDDILKAYKTIRGELHEYGNGVEDKPEIIALNKIDAIGLDLAKDQAKTLQKYLKKEGLNSEIHFVSAVSGEGVKEILFELAGIISQQRIARAAAERQDDDFIDDDEYEDEDTD